ncbi:hypothetical protein ABE10_01850, partial [Bacillus toyonensis]|nr:hypothetical protein [Bacillus toyonensis]
MAAPLAPLSDTAANHPRALRGRGLTARGGGIRPCLAPAGNRSYRRLAPSAAGDDQRRDESHDHEQRDDDSDEQDDLQDALARPASAGVDEPDESAHERAAHVRLPG